jgi:hypothetical protein
MSIQLVLQNISEVDVSDFGIIGDEYRILLEHEGKLVKVL